MIVFQVPITNSSALARTSNEIAGEGISGRRGGEVQTKRRRRDIQHRASVYRHEATSVECWLSFFDELSSKTNPTPGGTFVGSVCVMHDTCLLFYYY